MSTDPIELQLVFADQPLAVSVKMESDVPVGKDDVHGYIARTSIDGEEYRGAASMTRIDAVRSLLCWIRDCSNITGQEFQISLPLDKEELRKIMYR